jgi:hypothetical protein
VALDGFVVSFFFSASRSSGRNIVFIFGFSIILVIILELEIAFAFIGRLLTAFANLSLETNCGLSRNALVSLCLIPGMLWGQLWANLFEACNESLHVKAEFGKPFDGSRFQHFVLLEYTAKQPTDKLIAATVCNAVKTRAKTLS